MANEATAELYTKQSGLNKAKLKTDYDQYLADLARQYGISTKQLDTNLESRGILRSGEAGESRTQLSAAEEAARLSAQSDYDYNTATEDTNLMTRLAGLQAGSAGSGGSGGGTGGGGTGGGGTGNGGTGNGGTGNGSTTPPILYRSPMDPAFDGMRNRGLRPGTPTTARTGTADSMARNASRTPTTSRTGTADSMARNAPAPRPVRDATPRPPVPARVVNMPRPGTTTPARPVATPAPAPARTGTADTMARNAPAPAPALPDLSGVDWAALARMGTPRPVRDAAPRPPAPVTNAPRPGTTTTTRPGRGAR